jgi:hypothetical protein
MKKTPTPKVPKKHSTHKGAEPEQERAQIAPKRPRVSPGSLVVALSAALVFATAALKANQHEPKRAPCPCICAKA